MVSASYNKSITVVLGETISTRQRNLFERSVGKDYKSNLQELAEYAVVNIGDR